jgi:hypothetical protein
MIVLGMVCALAPGRATPLVAQHPLDDIEWMLHNLRPAGQPVIPIFDGWYPKPDGTSDLCFGYFNLNTQEAISIPRGPDNAIEPARFNGNQPEYFMPVPPPPNLYRRAFCVFTVNVPQDFPKTEKVVWTLRLRGRSYSVPGHLASVNYKIQELSAAEASRRSVAPVLRFEPSGPEGRGRSGVTAGPLTVAVGKPLKLPLTVTDPPPVPQKDGARTAMDADDDEDRPYIRNGKRRIWWAIWTKHQGPGDVVFSPQRIDIWEGERSAGTSATFSKPGAYVLLVQAIDSPGENGSFQFHCCWSNAYTRVTVTP